MFLKQACHTKGWERMGGEGRRGEEEWRKGEWRGGEVERRGG